MTVHRSPFLVVVVVLAACTKESRTAPPVDNRAPDAGSAVSVPNPDASGACVADCVKVNQMRATSPEQIEADCARECAP